MPKYKAFIFGLEYSIDLRIKILEVYGVSALVISQINRVWETRHHNLILYHEHVMKLISYFDEINFNHIPREENNLADALATLSSMFKVRWANEAPYITILRLDKPTLCYEIEEEAGDDKSWFYDIKRYLETREYPKDASCKNKKTLRKYETKFFLNGGVLYKRKYDSILLRCVDRHEANKIIEEIHEGSFRMYSSGHTMVKKILRECYY